MITHLNSMIDSWNFLSTAHWTFTWISWKSRFLWMSWCWKYLIKLFIVFWASSIRIRFSFSIAINVFLVFHSPTQSDLKLFCGKINKTFKTSKVMVSGPKLGIMQKRKSQHNKNIQEIVFMNSPRGFWGLRREKTKAGKFYGQSFSSFRIQSIFPVMNLSDDS